MSRPWPPEHPEVPPPPTPPRPAEPPWVPMVDLPSADVYERLLERRRLLLSGPLERQVASRLCAQLMALDGGSGDEVEVVVNSEGGPLADVVPLLDVMDLMRAPVTATCVGSARGTAAVLVACATGDRRAAPHARLSLRCDHRESFEGSAAELERRAAEVEEVRQRLEDAVVAATGQPADVIAAELARGPVHDAPGARDLGLIDRILTSDR